ncbi:MAG: AI-2E family transporter [Oscillospiraceae bacterium]|nr:AI-2E family transporter [Oscillospiraceae bacterium]
MKRGKKNRLFTRQTLSYMAVVFFGVLVYFLLSNLDSISAIFSRLISILSPFIFGAIIAFLLDVPMRFFERRFLGKFKRKRTLAIMMAYLSALVAIFLLFWIVVPQILDSARSLLGNINLYLDNLNELMDYLGHQFDISAEDIDQFRLSYEDILNQLLVLVRELLPDILNISMRIGSGIISLLTALIASIYMLASKDKLFRQCRRTLYAFVAKKAADELVRIFNLSVEVFSNFISGKILDSAIIGVICFVGMSLMNAVGIEMPFIPLISVIIAITNIIPFFGPFIGAVPSAMIILIVNPVSALWFTLFVTLLQQFDGNILGPRILGESTGLPPLWVLVAIIVGGGLFGFGGMVAGVPAVAVLHTLIHELVNNKLKAAGFNDEARFIDSADSATKTNDTSDDKNVENQDPPSAPQPDKNEDNNEDNP